MLAYFITSERLLTRTSRENLKFPLYLQDAISLTEMSAFFHFYL